MRARDLYSDLAGWMAGVDGNTEIVIAEPNDHADRRYEVARFAVEDGKLVLHREQYTWEFQQALDAAPDIRARIQAARSSATPEQPFTPDELRFAAYDRCPCGAGVAYPKNLVDMRGNWYCSAILMGKADVKVEHTRPLTFMMYDIKSEDQPSANGATTRPEEAAG